MLSKKKIIFLGDSLTHGANWQAWFPEYSITNLGVCGEKTSQILDRLEPVEAIQPEILFVMMGINDLGDGQSISGIIENWERFCEFIAKRIPNSRLIIQSLLPYNSELFPNPNLNNEMVLNINKVLAELVKFKSVSFLNLHGLFTDSKNELNSNLTDDGLHLNSAGYKIWKQEVAGYLKKL